MIGRNGERRSGISAQAARHDDDDITISSDLVSHHIVGMSDQDAAISYNHLLLPQLSGNISSF